MKKILLIHGPNLNILGHRDHSHYGKLSLHDIEDMVTSHASQSHHTVIPFQSNHEGSLIDFIQEYSPDAYGIIINPGAFTHYSYALHDALADTKLPIVEVHLSDISTREEWRHQSVIAPACIAQIQGKKEQGYLEALEILEKHI